MRIAAKTPILLTALMAVASCDTKEADTAANACTSTTAEAGPDQVIPLGDTAALNGVGSKLCPRITGLYTWTFLSVPTDSALTDASLSDNGTETAVQITFTPDVLGTYVVGLTVASGEIRSSEDIVIVEVTAGDHAPIADCGPDRTVMVGESATLDGSGSYDPEGKTLSYGWSLTSTPPDSGLTATSIFNTAGASPTVIPDVAGLYVVSLIVSDGAQWSDPDYCSVTATTDNQYPVADAGEGGILPPCADPEIPLNGFGSYDPEGEPLTYRWSLVANPLGSATSDDSFSDRTLPNPYFFWDVAGTYAFDLSVSDGELESAPDVVSVTILARGTNTSPIANAGDDQTISETGTCTGTVYTAITCADCPATTVPLDGTVSYDPDGDDINFYWSEPTGEIAISTPYSSTTNATTPAQPATFDVMTTSQWTIDLNVSDCVGGTSDSLILTYNCTGKR